MNLEVTMKKLREHFEQIWDEKTCLILFGEFDPRHLSRGQCYVTSICVQDILGGHVVEGSVDSCTHFWNKLPNGEEYDLTSDQFKGGDGIHPIKRRKVWCKHSPVNRRNKRYLLLKKRLVETEDLNSRTQYYRDSEMACLKSPKFGNLK
jgi:hypothetical protein